MYMGKSLETNNNKIRIDAWMWAARFYKTRSIARNAIQSGKVTYNGQKCKAGKFIDVGAVVRFKAGFDQKEVVIKVLSKIRGKAAIAQDLYEETKESLAQREKNQEARKLSAFHSPKPDHKPDKKQRRELFRIKTRDS
jgi:ribosome-associated heat shock protein Hsp15